MLALPAAEEQELDPAAVLFALLPQALVLLPVALVLINQQLIQAAVLFEALDEGRITIEDAVTDEYAGIYRLTNMRMVPADNPLGGDFVALHHIFQFSLNREAFYPSKSFLYYDWHKASMYFDMDELVQILEWYGYADKAAELRQSIGRDEFMTIAGKKYLHSDALAKVGIETDMILYLSSCTPVRLTIK